MRSACFCKQGSGDPSLGSWRWNETRGETIMQRWSNRIADQGIKTCLGIIVDLSVWPGVTQTVPDGYPWGGLGYWISDEMRLSTLEFLGTTMQRATVHSIGVRINFELFSLQVRALEVL